MTKKQQRRRRAIKVFDIYDNNPNPPRIFNNFDAEEHFRIRGFKIKRDDKGKILTVLPTRLRVFYCKDLSAIISAYLSFRDIYHVRCCGKVMARFNYIEYNVFFGKDGYMYGTYYIYDLNDNNVMGKRLSDVLGKWKNMTNVT